MPLISADLLGLLFLVSLAAFVIACAVEVIAAGIRANRAERARAAQAARQERADVAGRKANAESARWVG